MENDLSQLRNWRKKPLPLRQTVRSSAETRVAQEDISSLNQQVDSWIWGYDKNSKMLSMNIDQVKQFRLVREWATVEELKKQLAEAYQQTIGWIRIAWCGKQKYKAIQEEHFYFNMEEKGFLKDLQTTIDELNRLRRRSRLKMKTTLKEIQMQNAQQVADSCGWSWGKQTSVNYMAPE